MGRRYLGYYKIPPKNKRNQKRHKIVLALDKDNEIKFNQIINLSSEQILYSSLNDMEPNKQKDYKNIVTLNKEIKHSSLNGTNQSVDSNVNFDKSIGASVSGSKRSKVPISRSKDKNTKPKPVYFRKILPAKKLLNAVHSKPLEQCTIISKQLVNSPNKIQPTYILVPKTSIADIGKMPINLKNHIKLSSDNINLQKGSIAIDGTEMTNIQLKTNIKPRISVPLILRQKIKPARTLLPVQPIVLKQISNEEQCIEKGSNILLQNERPAAETCSYKSVETIFPVALRSVQSQDYSTLEIFENQIAAESDVQILGI